MDHRSFDDLAKLLGTARTRRAGLRAALGGLLGIGLGSAALDAEARRKGRAHGNDADADRRRRRRKKCSPPCAAGQTCRKGTCACDNGGTVCGANCCLTGQACQGGQCVTLPEPGQCVAAGEPCKNVGVPCCEGRVCASGQGGEADVACYVPKTGACGTTADCVYGMRCQEGRCAPPAPVAGLGVPCDSAAQQLCATPDATCAAYTGPGAPGGTYCALPLQRTCTGDPDCTCYRCWYTEATVAGQGRGGRISANTKACCHQPGQACAVEQDCCLGLSCVNGTCGGTMCVPDGAEGCGDAMPCCNAAAGSTCTAGTCTTGPGLGQTCNVSGPACITPAAVCSVANAAGTPPLQADFGTVCCLASGGACQGNVDCCFGGICASGSCAPCTIAATHVTPNVTNANSNGLTTPNAVAFFSDGRMVSTTESSSFAGAKVLAQNSPGVWTVVGSMSVPPATQSYSTQLPLGVAVDQDGAVYIAYKSIEGATQNRVIVFGESGGTWSQIGEFGQGSTNASENLRDPKFLAFGPDGRLYVTEAATNYGRVSVWRKSGGSWVFDEEFGSFATLRYPAGIAVNQAGDVFVASEYNANPNVSPVSVWARSGGAWSRTATIGTYYQSGTIQNSQFEQPYGLALAGSALVVMDNWQARMSVWQRISGTWTVQAVFGSFGADPNSATTALLGNAQGIAFGPDSLIYAADAGNFIISPWRLTCNASS